MCGIFAYFGNHISISQIEKEFQKTKMRGPDFSHLQWVREGWLLGFHRLKIVDTSDAGNQPMRREDCYLICNGEIYNHQELRTGVLQDLGEVGEVGDEETIFRSQSDCEVLPFAYRSWGIERLVSEIDGVFSMIIYDEEEDRVIIARDRFGVRPLFWGWNNHNELLVASEAKSIVHLVEQVSPFLPGHFWTGSCSGTTSNFLQGTLQTYYQPLYKTVTNNNNVTTTLTDVLANIRDLFTKAVHKRLMSDRPVGCLLSGGLDSSLVSSLVAREFKKRGKGTLQTFSVGLPGSPDLDYADLVAQKIGSKHHRVELPVEKWLSAIPEVIYAIESYDVTSVRASVGNWLIGKWIHENTDIVVVYNGDGSDEQSGYLYLGNAPTVQEFQEDICRLLREIYQFDVLRSDRSISSQWGLESRTPFLDRDFVDYYMGMVPTAWKTYGKLGAKVNHHGKTQTPEGRGIVEEKWLLRKAFESEDLLPSEVLWRKKEAFSDGCSSTKDSWHDIIQKEVETKISDGDFSNLAGNYSPRPINKEALYYRQIYESHFGVNRLVDHYWLPKWTQTRDPSARELGEY